MQPSSLVFVAIVVGWLVFLLPQWVRRREALGAAPGRDRHSTGLRVLDRRRRTTAGRSTLPLLPGAGGLLGHPSLLVDDPDDEENGFVYIPPARTAPDDSHHPSAGHERSGRWPSGSSAAAAPSTAAAPSPSAAAAARRRAVVLLALGSTSLLVWLLVALGRAPVPVALLPTLLTAGYVVALRSAARRSTAARRSGQPGQPGQPGQSGQPSRAGGPTPASGVWSEPAGTGATDVVADDDPRTVPDDVVEQGPVEDEPAEAATGQPDDGTWVPVPVPPPTYTLKPMAPRAEPAPLEEPSVPAVVGAGPRMSVVPDVPQAPDADRGRWAHVDPAAPVDLDEILARRRAVNG